MTGKSRRSCGGIGANPSGTCLGISQPADWLTIRVTVPSPALTQEWSTRIDIIFSVDYLYVQAVQVGNQHSHSRLWAEARLKTCTTKCIRKYSRDFPRHTYSVVTNAVRQTFTGTLTSVVTNTVGLAGRMEVANVTVG